MSRLKDCDVTWLYGPLQTHRGRALLPCDTPAGSRLSKTNSFLNKKPILKKRSMSEIMLQKSLSASSLLKQAAAAVQAQRNVTLPETFVRPRGLGRTVSDFVPSAIESRCGSGDGTSGDASTSSSGLQTPGVAERRRIHFNNKVEQCIAVEIRDEDDEDLEYAIEDDDADDDDDGSDEDVVMMKAASSKASSKAKISRRSTPRASISAESKTIAMLPSTTLKCRDETSESDETSAGSTSRLWSSQTLSPSPSQETLRPSRPSTNLLLDDDDDEADILWDPSEAFASRTADDGDHSSGRWQGRSDRTDDVETHRGLRRTPSGMFMPDEEDEDDIVAAGLFGRVIDTVNTARDIAHVIWNVGWRR